MLALKGKKVHFVGVGGVGVNALAQFALDMGAIVSGSDANINDLCALLQAKGGVVWQGVRAQNVRDVDMLVYSSAVSLQNEEIKTALLFGVRVYERFEFLGEVAKLFGQVVAIAGTHGKTTTTAMLTHILKGCKQNFLSMIGGESVDFANYVNNMNETNDTQDATFVVEACEYKKSLLSLNPSVAVVLNAECDHPDCYQNIQSVNKVFWQFFKQAKTCIVDRSYSHLLDCHLDGICDECILIANNGVVQSVAYQMYDDGTEKKLLVNGIECALANCGEYNLKNALFAICIAEQLGIDISTSIEKLKTFKGVKRRFERVKDLCGKPVFFDFAHHPTEIQSVIDRARKIGKLLVVFQPHTYSRTQAYLDDFAKVLSSHIEVLVLMTTYSAREDKSCGVESDTLMSAIKDRLCATSGIVLEGQAHCKMAQIANLLPAKNVENCMSETDDVLDISNVYLAKSMQSTLDIVKSCANKCDVILFVGAGDIYLLKDAW